jgi:hypothetical protein
MSIPLPFRKCSARDQVRRDWIDVLVQHGETPSEREDARILLVVLDAKSTGRANHNRSDREGRS